METTTAPAATWRFVKWEPTSPAGAYDFQVVRSGREAGRAFLPADRKPAARNFFVKLDNPDKARFVAAHLDVEATEALKAAGAAEAPPLLKPALARLINRFAA